MMIKNVGGLPLATNVCNQMLREVERTESWSMAHVLMNPRAESLLHHHKKMHEVYIITKGIGHLVIGEEIHEVVPGNVALIYPHVPHKLNNVGATSLEHLVLASPAFDPTDVFMNNDNVLVNTRPDRQSMPKVEECFDGAKIMAYEFPHLDFSLAFGWTMNDPERKKPRHCHLKTHEWIYIAEGKGKLEIGGALAMDIGDRDWIKIEPGQYHALRNPHVRDMTVVCLCSPRFNKSDVYFERK